MKKSGVDKYRSSAIPRILYEDDCLLVLDKPSGMVVNRAKTVKEKTLQDWIEEVRSPIGLRERSGIIHRLDKETSGLILVAKTQEAFENLQRQFKKRKVKKKYLALVHGKLEPKKGVVVLPVGRTKKDREKFGVVVEGRRARTKYKVLSIKYREKEVYSFLELEPLTGRTHQIRVHLSFLGHPIVADLKYAGKKARKDRHFCPRMFLHASYLGFHHPQTKNFCEFVASLPPELENAILKTCEKSSS